MENPCIDCGMSFKPHPNCSLSSGCSLLQMYKECVSMLKDVISEREYDRLTDHAQCNYWYCEKCGKYILRSWSKKCNCKGEKTND